MEALITLACFIPVLAIVWWADRDDKRRHERRMKELEAESTAHKRAMHMWKIGKDER